MHAILTDGLKAIAAMRYLAGEPPSASASAPLIDFVPLVLFHSRLGNWFALSPIFFNLQLSYLSSLLGIGLVMGQMTMLT
jgi:hypothetical protein